MGLESPTYISDLVPTNPVHTDGLNNADAHLRIIKSSLQATFPSVTGVVTATHTALNTVTGMAANVSTLQGNRIRNDISQTATGPLTLTGSLGASSIIQGGHVLIPMGVIVLWHGSVASVPAGWNLCDGTNGTPNLVGNFIVGAGASGTTVAQFGGQNLQTITTSTVGNHSHTGATAVAGSHSHTGTTNTIGAHSHNGNTTPYALTINDMPTHSHGLGSQGIIGSAGGNFLPAGGGFGAVVFQAEGGGAAHSHAIPSDGTHTHSVTTDTVASHSHSITSDGSHSHTVSIDVRPVYFALAYIMKL